MHDRVANIFEYAHLFDIVEQPSFMRMIDDIDQCPLIFKFVTVQCPEKLAYQKIDTATETAAKRFKPSELIDCIVLFEPDIPALPV